MAKASFVSFRGDNFELRDVLSETPRYLDLPQPEVVDGLNDAIFSDALAQLGLDGIEPTYRDGKLNLDAPEGYKFVITGAFYVWPDGNDIQWGYGPPTESYELWRKNNQVELEMLEDSGYSRELAEKRVIEEDRQTSRGVTEPPAIEHFSGPSISLNYNGFNWGAVVDPSRERQSSSDDHPSEVSVQLAGYRTHWREQAARFIQLPNSESDKLLTTHYYGQPGIIPCWKGYYAEGESSDIKIELVPTGQNDTERLIPPENKLWVPEKLRWSLYDRYPDLIDQMGDEASRNHQGAAIRMLGELAAAFGSKETNPLDAIANEPDLAVLDYPELTYIDLDELVETVEKMIKAHNDKPPSIDGRLEERQQRIEEDRANLANQLIVISEVPGSIHEAVQEFGLSDQWLEDHIENWYRYSY